MAERLFFIYDDSKYFTKNIKLGVTEHKANKVSILHSYYSIGQKCKGIQVVKRQYVIYQCITYEHRIECAMVNV